MSEKMQGGEIRIENRLTRWFDNYWYYYKWPVIIAAFVIIVVLVCTLQMCQKESSDVQIIYAGPHSFAGDGPRELASAFSAVLPEDFDGDGQKKVTVLHMLLYSEEQIAALKAEAEANDEENIILNSTYLAQELNKFNQLILSGEYSICLLDPWLYETVCESGGFLPLVDALGSKPEGAQDDYAIRLCDTDFGRYFTGAAALPEQTLLCFRREGTLSTLLNRDHAARTYQNSLSLFRAVMAFEE